MTSFVTTPVSDTYEDVKDLIFDLCHRCQKAFDGDWDDILGEAHVAFMHAFYSFDGSRGSFNTFLGTCIRNRIIDYVTRNSKENHLSLEHQNGSGSSLSDCIPDTARDHRIEDLLNGLSDEARYVIGLVFDPPEEVHRWASVRGGHAKNISSAVRDYLRMIGWSYPEITSVFNEIKTGLQEVC